MAEPRQKLQLVDEDFVPGPSPSSTELFQWERAQAIKEGRRRERQETQLKLGSWAIEQIQQRKLYAEAHEADILRLRQEWSETARHRASGARWQAFAIALALGLTVGAIGSAATLETGMFGIVAADRARAQPVWQPPAPAAYVPESHDPACTPLPGHRCPAEPRDAP